MKTTKVKHKSPIVKIRNLLLRIFLYLVLFCILATLILAIPFVQTQLARWATNTVNKEFGTHIFVDKVALSLITWDASLKGVFVEDYKKDTLFHIDALTASMLNARKLIGGDLDFRGIDAEGLLFKLKTHKGDSLTNLDVFVEKLDDGKPRDPNTPPFHFSTREVSVSDGRFILEDENREKTTMLDFEDMGIAVENLEILGPKVTMDINKLGFVTQKGARVKNLSTQFTYTKQQMLFEALDLQTEGSDLKGEISMDYNREDFADFLNKVKINASFEESVVALDDINQWFDQFGKGKQVTFASNITGTLNNMEVDIAYLESNDTGIRGDFNFRNLFSQEEGPFVLVADIKNITSSYYELRALLPNLLGKSLPPFFERIGQFTIRGDTEITERTIKAQTHIGTAVGDCYTDITLQGINQINSAQYSGFISLIDFDLGSVIENENLGITSFDFNVEGQGFEPGTLNTEVIGQVYGLEFNGYNYTNLKVSGVLKDQLFDGLLTSDDPNVRFRFSGLADFSSTPNNFNFEAFVAKADLNKMNILKDSIAVFKGDVNMDVSGNSIEDFVGELRFRNTEYRNMVDTYYFDDFEITSTFENDSVRTIEINSPDIINGYLTGNYKIEELGKVVQNSLGEMYANYKPFEVTPGQWMDFRFNIYNKIVDVFFPEIYLGANTFIRGQIDTDDGDFKLNFKSPGIMVYGNELQQIELRADNRSPLYNTYVSIKDVSTDVYDIKDFEIINTTLMDTLFFRTEFKGGRGYNDVYNLNFYHTFLGENKSVIGLKKSELGFKGNTWELNSAGNAKNKVVFTNNLDSIQVEEIVMSNGEERIRLDGHLADSTSKELELGFSKVSLEKILPPVDSLDIKGVLNGTLNVLQHNGMYLPSSNLTINNLTFNDAVDGDMSIGIVGNQDLTDFVVNAQLMDEGRELFSVMGDVDIVSGKSDANLLVNFDGLPLEPMGPLASDIFYNLRGFVQGTAQVKGDLTNPDVNGVLSLNRAGLGILILNTDYNIQHNATIRLEGQRFVFEEVGLQDVDYNTTASLSGNISHDLFKRWRLDLNLDTKDDRLLLLNTPFEEEVLYYGTAFLRGQGRIYGPTTALNISVNGATAEGTSLKIPLSDVTTVGDYSFINFIEKNKPPTFEEERALDDYTGVELTFDLDVTPDAEVEIVVDTKNGSVLKGSGEGILLMEINTNGKFNMFGEFVSVTGSFRYRLGGVIDKTFSVRPGGTLIWEGDPLKARMHMEAVYSLQANPNPLMDNPGYTRRIPTDVVINLDGELENPNIGFDIQFPGASSIVQSELEYRLQDPAVEERNAFFLLAQGSFANAQTGLNQQVVTGNLLQTASGLLNNALGTENSKFNMGLSYEQGNIDPTNEIQQEDRIGVTVSTQISDRVLINGRLGVPVGGVSESVLAGDVEMQILLNEDGTLSAKIFNRESEVQEFLGDRQGYVQGAGISYHVDFNSFRELLKKVFGQDIQTVPDNTPIPQESNQEELDRLP